MEVERDKSIELSPVVSPSDHVQLGDTSKGSFTFRRLYRTLINPVVDASAISSNSFLFWLTRRHAGRSNMTFSDGHAWNMEVFEIERYR